FEVVDDVDRAVDAARRLGYPAVLKVDGLAAGKGVLVARDAAEARAFAFECLVGGRFGAAAERLVVEAFLPGEEASLFFLTDGERVRRFLPARDYKRLADGDEGPNTGGMGAFAPARLDPALAQHVEDAVARPTLAALAAQGAPFRGLLYVGLMIGPAGPRVLEFNARFGDPETQVLLPLVDGDLGALLLECAEGRLASPLSFREGATVGVVLAAPGYPEAPRTGETIDGLDAWPAPDAEDRAECWCFHAGTKLEDGRVVTSGGRVLTVVARAADRAESRRRAYEAAARLRFPGAQVRTDVARDVTGAERVPARQARV
ncbi:MAG: phosphoribosylamine--glycine ligase, partial [Candidatus Eiseniibacteriota bacterium]